MGDEPIFGLMMIPSTDETYIEQSLTPFLESERVAEINVMLSQGHYFCGREIPPDRTEEILEGLKGPKLKTTKGEWPNEASARNLGMSLFQESNMILVFDPDEIILPPVLDKLMDWITAHPYQLYSMAFIGYWKDVNHQLAIKHPTGVVAVSREVHFDEGRIARGWREINIPAHEIHFHHFGLALPPKAQLEKCRRVPLHPLWYEQIWKNWKPEMENFHPTVPDAWPKAFEVEPDPALIEYLAQFKAKKEVVEVKEKKKEKATADEGTEPKRGSKSGGAAGRGHAESG